MPPTQKPTPKAWVSRSGALRNYFIPRYHRYLITDSNSVASAVGETKEPTVDVNEQVATLAASLATSMARNTASAVFDRIKARKTAGNTDATIAELEQIVNELVEDKAQIARVAQGYQAELVSQRLTPGDVEYITSSVLPLIKRFSSASEQDAEQLANTMAVIEPLLSIETVNVLQLLGFNFREAIGEPLTRLMASLIESRTPESAAITASLHKAALDHQAAMVFLARDPEAFERYKRLVAK